MPLRPAIMLKHLPKHYVLNISYSLYKMRRDGEQRKHDKFEDERKRKACGVVTEQLGWNHQFLFFGFSSFQLFSVLKSNKP